MFNRREEIKLPEIVIPTLYNTYDKPENPNNYSVWVSRKPKYFKGCIYIDGKWFEVINVVQDELTDEDFNSQKEFTVSKREYKLLEAIKEYVGR